MSKQSPYDNISISEGGRFVRYEWDVNYITDEQLETLRKHVETLQTENAKLRDALDFCLAYAPKCDECAAMLDCDECLRADASQKERKRLDYENAKLRELVRTFYHCTTSGECDECPINGGGSVHLMPDTICDTIHAHMREWGVDE